MTQCYLGLGSNLNSPVRQLRQAIASLHSLPHTSLQQQSSLYLSAPMGVRAQPYYYNMVIAINTTLPPKRLLHACQSIEKQQQRVKKTRWGARKIDIDILLYGTNTLLSRELCIPHLSLLKRDFVLVPLLEIEPNIQLPNGEFIRNYLAHCECFLSKSRV